eukprot:scaffold217355_cov32-Tisochrysis_lutea.AAC.1
MAGAEPPSFGPCLVGCWRHLSGRKPGHPKRGDDADDSDKGGPCPRGLGGKGRTLEKRSARLWPLVASRRQRRQAFSVVHEEDNTVVFNEYVFAQRATDK